MNKGKGIWYVIACILVIGIMTTTYTNKLLISQQSENSTAYASPESSFIAGETAKRSPKADSQEGGEAKAFSADSPSSMPSIEESTTGNSRMAAAPEPYQNGQEALAVEEKEEAIVEQSEAPSIAITPLETAPAAPASPYAYQLQEEYAAAEYKTRLNELDAQIMRIREEETDSNTYSMKSTAENELKLWDSELNTVYTKILEKVSEEEAALLIQEERNWMKERDALAVMAAKKSNGGAEGIEYTASLAASTRQRTYDLVDMYQNILETP